MEYDLLLDRMLELQRLREMAQHYEQIENGPVDVLGCWNWLSENYPDIAMEYQDGDGDNR